MPNHPIVRVAAVLLLAAPCVSAGQRDDLRDSRSRAMEMRAERKKVQEQMKADGFTPMIVGGDTAPAGAYPWIAAIVDADEESNYDGQFCGGSLIHPYWVLTAGHCVIGRKPDSIEILLGTNNLGGNSGQRIEVAEIVLAPGYNDTTLESDYALIRLKQPAAGLTPLPLIDEPSLAAPGMMATVAGWGDTTNDEGEYPQLLQHVKVPVVDLQVANETPAYGGTLSENMLPAGFAAGGKDSCYGDSGGPLIVESPVAPGWVQAGVVSFGLECGAPGIYGIYTRIGNFRNFVTSHLRPNYGEWERANNRSGENRDPDLNGLTNFEDFALPGGKALGQLVIGGMRRLSYLRPVVAPEVDYIIENAPAPGGPWTRIFPAFVSSLPATGGVQWTVELPDSPTPGHFRLRVEYAAAPVHEGRPLSFGKGTIGSLDETDRQEGGSGRVRRYLLEFPSSADGRHVRLTLRSADFDAALRVLREDGEVVRSSNNGSARGLNGQDESVDFPKLAGVRYVAEVVADSVAGGDFELSLWDAEAFAAQPKLALLATPKGKVKPAKLKGSLSTTDAIDPVMQPGPVYYKDDFALDFAALSQGRLVELKMASKGRGASSIDDFLTLIDAESGRSITTNDNLKGKSNDAALRFMPVAGRSYLLRASSADPGDTGNYLLSLAMPKLTPKSPLASISPGATVKGKLSAASEQDDWYYTAKRDYLLEAASNGQTVTANLSAPKFNAVIVALDASTLATVASGDGDGSGGGLDDATVSFVATPGHRYIIRATTYEEGESGTYTLSISQTP